MAVNGNNALKSKLLIFFIIGIVLYVYGQEIMREKLIDFTNEIVYFNRMKIVNKLLGIQFSKFEQIEKVELSQP